MSKKKPAANRLLERLLPTGNEHGPLLGALATSYELDPLFVATDVLPAIFGLGDWDERDLASPVKLEQELAKLTGFSILADARRYQGRPRSLRLEVIPRIGDGGQKLHAKILLLVHERAVRLHVSSANLTETGYRANREVALSLVADDANPEIVPVVREAIEGMSNHLKAWWSPTADHVSKQAIAVLDNLGTSRGASAQFAWSGGEVRLWRSFVQRWRNDVPVRSITIVSPFWSAEDGETAPLASLCAWVRSGPGFAPKAKLRLLTEAIPLGQNSWRPRIPPVLDFDPTAFGLEATIEAVDPTVAQGESEPGDLKTRPLHAKVVVLEGEGHTLAYAGSANFTRQGWGFLPANARANVEAGVLLWDIDGRTLSAALVPPATGTPVRLDGQGGLQSDPPDTTPDPVFPTFIKEAVLSRDPRDPDRLDLVLELLAPAVTGEFVMLTASEPFVELGRAGQGVGAAVRMPIPSGDLLRRLYRDEQIRVRWWSSPEPRPFPLNVSLDVRLLLPLVPGASDPSERMLIEFFQGKLDVADVYREALASGDEQKDSATPAAEASSVDTRAIEAYQVREFVEALPGIEAELVRASEASAPAMRLALLGAVSPIALARAAVDAARNGRRSHTASAFQLCELAALLAEAREVSVEPPRHIAWKKTTGEAEGMVLAWLDELTASAPKELGPGTSFAVYRRELVGKSRSARQG